MKPNNINVSSAIADAEKLLAEEKDISPALKASVKLILVLVRTMVERLSLNSKNSSKPPSTDKKKKKIRVRRKANQNENQEDNLVVLVSSSNQLIIQTK